MVVLSFIIAVAPVYINSERIFDYLFFPFSRLEIVLFTSSDFCIMRISHCFFLPTTFYSVAWSACKILTKAVLTAASYRGCIFVSKASCVLILRHVHSNLCNLYRKTYNLYQGGRKNNFPVI